MHRELGGTSAWCWLGKEGQGQLFGSTLLAHLHMNMDGRSKCANPLARLVISTAQTNDGTANVLRLTSRLRKQADLLDLLDLIYCCCCFQGSCPSHRNRNQRSDVTMGTLSVLLCCLVCLLAAPAAAAKSPQHYAEFLPCEWPQLDTAVQHFSEILQFHTVSNASHPLHADPVVWGLLDLWMRDAYPDVFSALSVEQVRSSNSPASCCLTT